MSAYTPEERTAWDQVAAAVVATADISRPAIAARLAAECADAVIAERRLRFTAPAPKQ